jgi:hypothetical protein
MTKEVKAYLDATKERQVKKGQCRYCGQRHPYNHMAFCSQLKPYRCDACDYRVAKRVRIHLVADASWKHWTTSGLLVCPECATYLVDEGIATRSKGPRAKAHRIRVHDLSTGRDRTITIIG